MPERKDAAGAGTAAAMADLPTTRLRWLGSVRGPLFLPGPRRVSRHATPLMTRSQRPATNRDLTRQMILERPWRERDAITFALDSITLAWTFLYPRLVTRRQLSALGRRIERQI